MNRTLSQLQDSLMVRGNYFIHRGLRQRFPQLLACEPCGLDRLATIEGPDRVETRELPAWRGWQRTSFRFRSLIDSGIPECASVAGILLRAQEDGPWVVIVHGRGQGSVPPRTFGFFQSLQGRALLEHGVNVLLFELPLHLSRRRHGMPSDHGMFGPDFRLVQRIFLQAAGDAVACVRWLKSISGQPVGLWGTSVGGALAGLAASAVPSIDALVLQCYLDSVADFLNDYPWYPEVRAEMTRGLIGREELDSMLKHLAPSTYKPKLALEDILLVISRWDLLTRYEAQTRVRDAWGGPPSWVVDHGHITCAFDRALARRIAAHLAGRLKVKMGGLPAMQPESR